MNLNMIWFFLVGLLLVGYAVLDGFDLGVGILYPLAKTEEERNALLEAIGPVWNGNEVWLVAGGGALFAAFPNVYATLFSGFYLAFILMLVALIFRAVALEFRNKETWGWWRKLWDIVFVLGSAGSTFLFGVMVGNIILGLPIQANMDFQSAMFLNLFHPYAILVGLFILSLFALHGAMYLHLKTQTLLQERVKQWTRFWYSAFIGLYLLTTGALFVKQFSIIRHVQAHWWTWGIVIFLIIAILSIPFCLRQKKEVTALLASGGVITVTFFLFGMGLYPTLLPSRLDSTWNLTIYNAAASEKTLFIMLIVAAIGLPFVLAYTFGVYWVFRGKVYTEDKLL